METKLLKLAILDYFQEKGEARRKKLRTKALELVDKDGCLDDLKKVRYIILKHAPDTKFPEQDYKFKVGNEILDLEMPGFPTVDFPLVPLYAATQKALVAHNEAFSKQMADLQAMFKLTAPHSRKHAELMIQFPELIPYIAKYLPRPIAERKREAARYVKWFMTAPMAAIVKEE